ncbi:MAG: response regulator transcription factor [Oscillochloris sp.]|nr:response regulator transcription factor [Oscillochloris sp.]
MKQAILVVDDHASVRTMIAEYLEEQGYRVLTAGDGNEGLMLARRMRPDLILLDIMMPGLDGLGFLQAYRRDHTAPVILLTARIEETDKVVGLELGADDYITKPFGMKELVARIRAVLRRVSTAQQSTTQEQLRVGDLLLDHTMREVRVAGQAVNLTPSEFSLLSLLMASPGRVYSREQLLEHLQGNAFEGVERTIDVHIRNLRKKLEPDPARPRYVETVFGAGYRCCAQPDR